MIDALKKVLRKREKAKLAMVSKTLRECIDGEGKYRRRDKKKGERKQGR